MTRRAFEAIAREYERAYGEPLVADEDWVGPIFDTVEAAVACDPNFEGVREETGTDFEAEVVYRTAAVIAVITHGPAVLRIAELAARLS